jgi:hypothetical protein
VAVPSSRSGGLDAAVAAWEEAESEGEGKESELAEEMPPPAVRSSRGNIGGNGSSSGSTDTIHTAADGGGAPEVAGEELSSG